MLRVSGVNLAVFTRHRLASALSRVLLLIGCAPVILALDPSKTLTQYAHRIWGQEEGLFQPTIYSILQTRDGFLWLGTQDSLIRFDGMHFREFDRNGQAVLHGSLVRSLLEDRDGNLWIGSIGNGLARISANGVFKRYAAQDGLPIANVFCLDSDAKGQLWVCTDKGLARFDGQAFHLFSSAQGLSGPAVHLTCEAADHTRWVTGLTFPLARWNGTNFEPYSGAGISTSDTITALACGRDGSIWVGKETGLTRIKDASARTFTTSDGLPDNSVSSLKEAEDGTLWIGTEGGISRYSNGEMSVYRVRDGLSHSLVLSLYLDREGTLWAGTKDGLDQFTNPKVTPYTTNEGVSSNEASAVIEDHEGRLWIGTLDGGLNVFDGRHFEQITTANGLTSNRILSLAVDREGNLWTGTNHGLNRLSNGRVIATYTEKNGLSGPQVRALLVDKDNQLWAGTDGGLDKFASNTFTEVKLLGNPAPKSIVALSGDDAMQLAVSTEPNHLDVLQGNNFTSYPLVNVIREVDCYFRDPEGSLWMGTLGSGLLRWRQGSLNRIHVKDGLYDGRIYSILSDGHSNLWMASSKGIFRVSLKELNEFADGKARSIRSIPFSTGQLRFECRAGVQPAACRTHDGRLWFSTTSGLVVVDPAHLASNTISPPARITAVLINGQRFEPSEPLRIKPLSGRNLEIRYAGLSFVSPEKVTFSYMLEGYDKSWTDAGTRREAFFTNLPPGEYHFKVKARNADGFWSTQAASVNFSVLPSLYQRAWFLPALVGTMTLMIVAGYRTRVRRLQQSFDLVLAERGRIARELHDTLLQGLSGVTMQLQALWTRLPPSKEKQTLGEIINDAGACSAEARQSLWDLRANVPRTSPFSNKLADLCREAIAGTNVSLALHLDPVSLDRLPAIEFQLLRIAREAIANTLQHAGATMLEIKLYLNRRELRLTIEDNGSGFSTYVDHQQFGHFGLLGMRERAREIGASLDVSSSPRAGTIVSVRLPFDKSLVRENTRESVGSHRLT